MYPRKVNFSNLSLMRLITYTRSWKLMQDERECMKRELGMGFMDSVQDRCGPIQTWPFIYFANLC
jgi:hypothetical protein